ncbi:MAG: 2TM domain-containing protein [Rectinemataceae bacterium]
MEQKDYRLAAIMYMEVAGFSRMTEKDEAGILELVAGIVERRHGTVIKRIGDAILIDFKNTVEALQSALEAQDGLHSRNKENAGPPILARIGIHLGDIYFFEDDAIGEGINIAARLQSLAGPGCICLSQDVYNLVLDKIEFKSEELGKVPLKNITKEIKAYEITTPNAGHDPDVAARTPAPSQTSAPTQVERSFSEEGSRNLLTEIRRAILQDTKAMGRRLGVDEALERYSFYGVEAQEVIASMADQGLLIKRDRVQEPPEPPSAPMFTSGFGNNASGQFDPNAIKQNIQAAVHGIVNEIERSVERSLSSGDRARYAEKYARHAERHADRYRERAERHAERYRERHEIRAESRREAEGLVTGKWDRRLLDDDKWKPGPEELMSDFEAYKRSLEARCRKQRGGFIGNLTSYLTVNGFLWFLNFTTPHKILWAAIVSAAWGIGLVSSMVAASRAGEKLREIESMPDLDREQLADYKKLNRVKDSMAMHGASTLMVPVLLAVINFLASGFFGRLGPWFLIPTAAMVVGYFSHLASFAATKPRLERKLLDSLGIRGGWRNIFRRGKRRREEAVGLGPYTDLYREAEAAKEAIAAQLKAGSAGDGVPLDADLAPTLEQYLGQLRLLALSANEIDRLVEGIPMADLSKDRAALVAKQQTASESLKVEYTKSIEEIDKQERSYQELKEQSEVLRLRLGSSVNQLKQMRLDIARVQASPGAEGEAGIEGLKRRSDELSRYLEDLRSGYAGSVDPFAELEEAERSRERARLAEAEKAKSAIEGPREPD